MKCPKCGGECEREEHDFGACEPWGCPACHWTPEPVFLTEVIEYVPIPLPDPKILFAYGDLQRPPPRTEAGRQLRASYLETVARAGPIIHTDFSALEIRLAAEYLRHKRDRDP